MRLVVGMARRMVIGVVGRVVLRFVVLVVVLMVVGRLVGVVVLGMPGERVFHLRLLTAVVGVRIAVYFGDQDVGFGEVIAAASASL
jgi:hypothetical protein